MINIVKVYDKQVPGTHREYCGRSGKGKEGVLGNPFNMSNESQRNIVCDQFEMYFKESMSYEHSALRNRINELIEIAKIQDIELACFCAPKRCHTETIKAYIEQQLEESKMKTQVNESRQTKELLVNLIGQIVQFEYEPGVVVIATINSISQDGKALNLVWHNHSHWFEDYADRLDELTWVKPLHTGIIKPVVNQMECVPSFRNELAFLSNMYESNLNGFKCAEAWYQAHKVAGTEAYTTFLGLNGYEAKRLGKQVELRSDWDEVKLSIMEKILRTKFQGELLQKLLAVKGEIVERNNWGNSYWGICNGKGENNLGKLLMKIRDENIKQQIPSMTYAGIGSRETPGNILIEMKYLADELQTLGFKLYSGAADGADKAFSDGCTNKVEFLPWKGFNNSNSEYCIPSPKAFELASEIHPNWNALREGGRKLMARNCYQILGLDLKSPVDFVLCWTPDGAETKTGYNTGGTGQAIRLANRYGIPIINMYNKNWKQKLDVLLEDIHILNQANQIILSTY